MGDCIFCKIVKGEIPAVKVYEDESVLAFMDINPINDGHTLVIPKKHAENIFEIEAKDLLAVMEVAHKIARAIKESLKPEALTVVQLNGRLAGQMVPHLHVHLIPRREGDALKVSWEMIPGDMEKIKAAAEKIKGALR
ncbi:MAG: HIT family protein [Deltaproteobacteria bacterium]|nr:HIT family protein [Deltaproteobacteria bacterium]